MNELQQQRAKLEGLVDTQIDSASGLTINCRNCIHCKKILLVLNLISV